MKVVMLSKALVVGAYQRKLEELAALPDVELTALVPPSWREPRVGETRLERRFTRGYQLEELPIALNGHHHTHFYPTLGQVLQRLRPDIFHIDEESFNLATFHALWLGRNVGARCCFYNWANIDRRYPPPFAWFERYNLRHAAHAIVGNQEAADIVQRHGYRGPVTIIPQFGVDPELFGFGERAQPQQPFVVGYLGRLVPEKGVLDLLDAVAGLDGVCLRFIGDGAARSEIEQRSSDPALAGRVELLPSVSSTAVPEALRTLDALALPSRTRPNWKEQFGRILVEAMSCGVPPIGSSSGEIPNVIGEGGLIFPEGDVNALRAAIVALRDNPARWAELRRKGRERVLAQFTQAAIARRHFEVYQAMQQQPRVG